jgi:hypothetical protein
MYGIDLDLLQRFLAEHPEWGENARPSANGDDVLITTTDLMMLANWLAARGVLCAEAALMMRRLDKYAGKMIAAPNN